MPSISERFGALLRFLGGLGGGVFYTEVKVPFSALVSKNCQVKVGHADRDLPKHEKGALTKYLRLCVLCNRGVFLSP